MTVDLLRAAAAHVVANPAEFREALVTHLVLSGVALGAAIAIAVPLGIAVVEAPRGAPVAINAANVLRTIPSLAVLAFVLPVLGIGFRPAILALILLGIPPILINTHVGLRQIDPDVIESARGMGMTTAQVLRRIQVPLAMPVVLAGVKTAAVQIVAGATLAAFIGGGGLGDFITTGIGMMQVDLMLVGAIPVTLLAIAVELAFGRLERALSPRGTGERP